MPDTPRTPSECIEAEREVWKKWASWPMLPEDIEAARSATDEAVKAVEGLVAAADTRPLSEPWRSASGAYVAVPREWLRALDAARDAIATPAPTAQGDTTGGRDE